MNSEVKYLIELLEKHLIGERVTLKTDINYKKLYNCAKAHNLSAILFSIVNTSENKDAVEKVVFDRLRNDFLDSVMRYDIQSEIISDFDALLSDGKIYHIFFKGAEIREYYPVPQARVMGDIDVLIEESRRDEVKKLLTQNGYTAVNTNGAVYDYEKDGVRLEVHTRIISGRVGSSNAEEGFADAVTHGKSKGNSLSDTLETDYHFAYLIAHLAHHFWFYGAGIKLIFDLAVFQKQFEINYEKALEILREVSLYEFAKVALSVCHKWFGVGKDFSCDTEKTEEFIVSFGVFGNVNRNNAAVIQRKELEEGKRSSAVSTRIRLMFPPYEKMKNIPYISFIEGRPYLTPLAWVYRIFYNLKYRKSFVKDATKSIGSDESIKEAEKELAYFKEVGLL